MAAPVGVYKSVERDALHPDESAMNEPTTHRVFGDIVFLVLEAAPRGLSFNVRPRPRLRKPTCSVRADVRCDAKDVAKSVLAFLECIGIPCKCDLVFIFCIESCG